MPRPGRDRAVRGRRRRAPRTWPCTPPGSSAAAASSARAGAAIVVGRHRRGRAPCGRRRSRSRRPPRRAAIGPPRAASGAMWPIISPWVPPENRPSVISATESPRPSPTSAAGHAQHLLHAGPADRSLVADHDDVAGHDPPVADRLEAVASPSRRPGPGPRCRRRSWPASLTTQPSGAREPWRIARPPVGLIGVSIGTTTVLAVGVRRASAAISAIVRPSTVGAAAVEQAGRLSSSRMTSATPPASYRSEAV